MLRGPTTEQTFWGMRSWRHQSPVTRRNLLPGGVVSTGALVVKRDGRGGVSQVTQAPTPEISCPSCTPSSRLARHPYRVKIREGRIPCRQSLGGMVGSSIFVTAVVLSPKWCPDTAQHPVVLFRVVVWVSTCAVEKRSEPSLLAKSTSWCLVASASPSRLPQAVRVFDHQTLGRRSSNPSPA